MQDNSFPGRPTLVFLHDSLGCIALWRDFPSQLAQALQLNLLVYDRQGYGNSCGFAYNQRGLDYMHQEALILKDLLDFHSVGEVVLFGHSDGGSIALLAAAIFPDRFKAIVTQGAHVYVEEITLAGIREAQHTYQSTDLPRRLARYHGDKTDAMFQAWADTWTRPDFRDWNIESFLPSITGPVLALQGQEDEFGSPQQVADIVRQVSGRADSFLFPGLKHNPHKEAPEQVMDVVKGFLKSF